MNPLRNGPVTHIAAFLLLHEITAIAPIYGLAAFSHYSRWMPPLIGEGKWVSAGMEKFGNYFRKKGWLGDEKTRLYKWWGRGRGRRGGWLSVFLMLFCLFRLLLFFWGGWQGKPTDCVASRFEVIVTVLALLPWLSFARVLQF